METVTCNCPVFAPGSVVRTAKGEVEINEYLGIKNGLHTYLVTSADIQIINKHPVNQWIAQIVPILTITGVSPTNYED